MTMYQPKPDIQIKTPPSDHFDQPTDRAYKTTSQLINQLWSGGHPSPALMNKLRTSRSITDHSAIQTWPLLFSTMAANDLSRFGSPTKMETAIFSALHCYAIYQRGNARFMHRHSTYTSNTQFMAAINHVRTHTHHKTALDRRIQPLLSAIDISTTINALYRFIDILHAQPHPVPLDFSALAADLYALQTPTLKTNVLLHWGQQYYAQPKATPTANPNN